MKLARTGSISPTYLRGVLMRSFFWGNGKRRINLAIFTLHNGQISSAKNVGEIDQQIFYQTLCTGDFLLGAQRLVKLTPVGNNIKGFKR